ncbi:MAG: helix-turn-helix domain-containing protein [Campylobacteraceae bacterium]|nr:helix-turn-helix domain-containing protein [Campylobacteraceae bacterium]
MIGKIALVSEETINSILDMQQKILRLLQNGTNNNTDTFCSVNEAANILGYSPQKVRQMVEEGTLKKKKGMGRAIRIYRSSIMQ